MQVFKIFLKWTYVSTVVKIKYSIVVNIVNILKVWVNLLLLKF